MAEEFTINSNSIETKINQLLPSQGGRGAGVDFSASTMIVPVVNLNDAAEGSTLREDLQEAWDFATGHNTVENTTTTIINTTGFWKIGINMTTGGTVSSKLATIKITDGLSSKVVWQSDTAATGGAQVANLVDEIKVYVRAGDSVTVQSNAVDVHLNVWYRQIADLQGNLTNPSGYV